MFFLKDKKNKIIFGSSEKVIERLFYSLTMKNRISLPETYFDKKLTKFKDYKIFLFIRNPYERAVWQHLNNEINYEPQLSGAWNNDILQHDKLYIFDISQDNFNFIETIYNTKIKIPLIYKVEDYKKYLKDTKTIIDITLMFSKDLKFFRTKGFNFY
jgi:hypothetical protein